MLVPRLKVEIFFLFDEKNYKMNKKFPFFSIDVTEINLCEQYMLDNNTKILLKCISFVPLSLSDDLLKIFLLPDENSIYINKFSYIEPNLFQKCGYKQKMSYIFRKI